MLQRLYTTLIDRPPGPAEVHENDVPAVAAPSHPVGLLYVVWQNSAAPVSKVHSYVAEAHSSCAATRHAAPELPVALATNVAVAHTSCFSVVQNLTLDSADVRRPWAPRLRALQSSPFQLTLMLDSQAVVCARKLVPLLRRELSLDTFDVGIGVEAFLGLPRTAPPKGMWPTAFPTSVRELVPHNWALLLRRGRGADALIDLWLRELDAQSDDQLSLRNVLGRTEGRRCAASAADDAPRCVRVRSCGGDGEERPWVLRLLGLPSCRWREQPVRVARLRESFAAMLSLSKRQYGFFPRYTRALAAGEVALAVHSPRPFQWTGNVVPSSGTVVRHRDVCAALNAEVNSSRLVLQMRTGAAHHVPTSRRDCYAAAELGAVWNGSRAMRRVCDLLPAGQPAAPSQQRLVEPMEQFWRRMREARSSEARLAQVCAVCRA